MVQINEEQGQRREPLLAVNDIALPFFLAENDRTEEVVPVFGDRVTLLAGFVVFEEFAAQIVDELDELFSLPFVFSLVAVNGVAAVVEQFPEGAALPVYVAALNIGVGFSAHGWTSAFTPMTASSRPSASFSTARMSARISSSVRSGCGL
jgi:hypothetical protein